MKAKLARLRLSTNKNAADRGCGAHAAASSPMPVTKRKRRYFCTTKKNQIGAITGDLLIVGAGGAFGSISRYLVYVATTKYLGVEFPFGTLVVNIVGSFLMGVLIELLALVWDTTPHVRLLLAVGFLGAFTTFSTFSLDVSVLYERKWYALTSIYILTSVVLSIGALFAGLHVVRRLAS